VCDEVEKALKKSSDKIVKIIKAAGFSDAQFNDIADGGSNPRAFRNCFFFPFFSTDRLLLNGNRYRKLQFDIFTARVQWGSYKNVFIP